MYGDFVEGYEETNEPRYSFGKIVGFDSYLIIENNILKSFCVEEQHLIIDTKNTELLPTKLMIYGGAILDLDYDMECLCIHLEGGHSDTRQIIANLNLLSKRI